MQEDEVIINGFIKTIKESSVDITGDPVILNRVFQALDKKRKKRRFFLFFIILTVAVSSLSLALGVNYYRNQDLHENKTMAGLMDSKEVDLHTYLNVTTDVKEEANTLPKEKTNKPVVKRQQQNLTVSYKFNNHQVDVLQQGSEEFIQINVFGSDGSEIDVFKMMEELKESYQNNELRVDSVNHHPPGKIYRSVRRPVIK